MVSANSANQELVSHDSRETPTSWLSVCDWPLAHWPLSGQPTFLSSQWMGGPLVSSWWMSGRQLCVSDHDFLSLTFLIGQWSSDCVPRHHFLDLSTDTQLDVFFMMIEYYCALLFFHRAHQAQDFLHGDLSWKSHPSIALRFWPRASHSILIIHWNQRDFWAWTRVPTLLITGLASRGSSSRLIWGWK